LAGRRKNGPVLIPARYRAGVLYLLEDMGLPDGTVCKIILHSVYDPANISVGAQHCCAPARQIKNALGHIFLLVFSAPATSARRRIQRNRVGRDKPASEISRSSFSLVRLRTRAVQHVFFNSECCHFVRAELQADLAT